MVLQIGQDLLAQLVLVRAFHVEPEHHRHAGLACPGDSQLHPVADRCVLDDGHPPDVALFHVLRQQHLPAVDVDDVGDAVLGDLEGLVVAAVLLGLLRHQPHVGDGAHRRRIELALGLTEVDDLLVDAGEGGLRVDRLGVLELPVGAVHLAAGPDHRGHGRVHDHVGRRVEVGDTPGRVHHGQLRPVFVAGVQVFDDLVAL